MTWSPPAAPGGSAYGTPSTPTGCARSWSSPTGAVATSARYERGDHIIDGRTGRPATGLLSLTVVAPTLTEADSVATAAFAMGAEGVEWAAARESCEVFAVDAGHRVRDCRGSPGNGRRRNRPVKLLKGSLPNGRGPKA